MHKSGIDSLPFPCECQDPGCNDSIILPSAYPKLNSHWKKIGQLPPQSNGRPTSISCGYFWNQKKGLVGTGVNVQATLDLANPPSIFFFENGQWNESIHPNNLIGGITNITMLDTLIGWATLNNIGNSIGLWKTMDGGHTWIELDTSFLRCNLNYNIISTESGIYFSNNGNMNVFSTDYYNCVDLYGLIFSWIDSNIAMMTLPPGSFAFPSTLFSRSIDGGITWSTINPKESLLPFGIYYSQYWSKLFTAPLEFTADTMVYSPGDTTVFPGDTTKIRPFISFDKGTTWEFYGNWPQIYGHWLPTGDVEGAGKAVYVQSAYVPQNIGVMNGLWRSMDGGKSWQNIGGPSNYCHTRFSVLGCNGEIVIAYDVYGEIWETTDGGDGSLSEMIPSKDSITFSSQYCTPSLDTIIIIVQNCNEDIDTFSFIKITSLDSMLLDSGILQILPFQSNPMLLTLNVQDSFTILWSPLNKFKTDTTIHAKVLFWYYSYLNDTTIADTLQLSFIINMPKSLSYIFSKYIEFWFS